MCYFSSSRNYEQLYHNILSEKETFNKYYENEGKICGYMISKNEPLSKIYNNNFYVIKLYFAGFDTLHIPGQEIMMEELYQYLDREMKTKPGYYNLRIPIQMIDGLKAFNSIMRGYIFCGGTVAGMSCNAVPFNDGKDINIFIASDEYLTVNRQRMKDITLHSFRNYQGQYHISPVTNAKAGKVYENWIEDSFHEIDKNRVVVAEYHNTMIGYVMFESGEWIMDGALTTVDEKYRSYGAYRKMIEFCINFAHKNNKHFITNTQLDNFIVQGTWSKLGMKPYHSIYNFHFDNR
jgi:hypothetical protein